MNPLTFNYLYDMNKGLPKGRSDHLQYNSVMYLSLPALIMVPTLNCQVDIRDACMDNKVKSYISASMLYCFLNNTIVNVVLP